MDPKKLLAYADGISKSPHYELQTEGKKLVKEALENLINAIKKTHKDAFKAAVQLDKTIQGVLHGKQLEEFIKLHEQEKNKEKGTISVGTVELKGMISKAQAVLELISPENPKKTKLLETIAKASQNQSSDLKEIIPDYYSLTKIMNEALIEEGKLVLPKLDRNGGNYIDLQKDMSLAQDRHTLLSPMLLQGVIAQLQQSLSIIHAHLKINRK